MDITIVTSDTDAIDEELIRTANEDLGYFVGDITIQHRWRG